MSLDLFSEETPRGSILKSNHLLEATTNSPHLGVGGHIRNRIHTGLGKPGKSWNLRISFSRPEKSWNFVFGHRKSWQIKVLFDRSVTADDKARTM